MFEYNALTLKELESIQSKRKEQIKAAEKLIDIVQKSDIVFNCFLEALKETGHQPVYDVIVSQIYKGMYVSFLSFGACFNFVYVASIIMPVDRISMFPLCSDFDEKFAHTQTIRQHYVFLVDTLDAKHSGFAAELYRDEVLRREEMESINSETVSFSQNEKLLSFLSRKTSDDFDKFLDALDKTGQQHVRNHITGRKRVFLLLFC